MDEPSIALDPRNQVSTSGALLLSFCSMKEAFVAGSSGQVFFPMRHNANSKQEVHFQENYVG
jgi:hypothetical protein